MNNCIPSCQPICCENEVCSSDTLLKCSHYSGDDLECGDLLITKADTGDEAFKKIVEFLCTLQEQINQDIHVKISAGDTTTSYLSNKLEQGAGIKVEKINTGLNEKLRISLDNSTSNETPISKVDSSSIAINLSGSKNHTITASTKISTNGGNILSIDNSGLYVPEQAPILNEDLNFIDTSNIDFTKTGDDVSAEVRISSRDNNILINETDGLFVEAADTQEELNFVDTNSVDFSQIENDVSANVKISATSNNNIIVETDGLFVQDNSSDNGITKTNDNFQLGGSLIKDTSISGNYKLQLSQGKLNISAVGSDSKLNSFSQTKDTAISGTLNASIDDTSQIIATQFQNIMDGASVTRNLDKHIAGSSLSLVLLPVGDQVYNGGIVSGAYSELAASVRDAAEVTGKLSSFATSAIITNDSNYSEISSLRVISPTSAMYNQLTFLFTGNVANYIGLKIEASDANANLVNNITNKYGIKQEGINDKNVFAGKVYIGGASLNNTYNLNVAGDIKHNGRLVNTPQNLVDGNWNLSSGTNAKLVLGSPITLNITGLVAGTYFTLKAIQDGLGGRTITLPAGSKVANGGNGAITLTSTPGAVDLLCGYYDGEFIYWTYKLNYT